MMNVSVIKTRDKFNEIKSDWNRIYAADVNASVFVSWDFIRGWIDGNADKWIVLSVESVDTERLSAFFVLNKRKGGTILRTCDPALFDHTSFICLPGHETVALKEIAQFIQGELAWEKLELLEVMDDRLDLFLSYFPANQYRLSEGDRTICPYIPLENTWDKYLFDHLSQKGRKKLRKFLRDIEKLDDYRITNIDPENVERHIEILLSLWQSRWGSANPANLKHLKSIFQRTFKENHLFLPIIWCGNKPISASVAFVDVDKKCFYDYIGGWDEAYSKMSPGNTLIAYGIKYAIDKEIETYDFLRGNEDYKYTTFAARKKYNRNVVIERKGLKPTVHKLKKRLRQFLA